MQVLSHQPNALPYPLCEAAAGCGRGCATSVSSAAAPCEARAPVSLYFMLRHIVDHLIVGYLPPTLRPIFARTRSSPIGPVWSTLRTGAFELTNTGHDDPSLGLSSLRRGFVACGLQEDLAGHRVVGSSRSSRPLRSAHWVWCIYRIHEALGPFRAAWCLAQYAIRAFLKQRSL